METAPIMPWPQQAVIDIALEDEAHYARRKNPTAGSQAPPGYGYLYPAIEEALRPKARSLWLATATPMQLDAAIGFRLANTLRFQIR
jgi:hypothetical protein